MSGLFRQFKTNQTAEQQGVRISIEESPNDDGSVPTFFVARTAKSNVEYSKALERATRPYRRQLELGTMKNEVGDRLLLDVFVDSILKGWENVQDESGQEIPFTPENARKLMQDLPDLYDRLQEEAKTASNYREASLQAEAKN